MKKLKFQTSDWLMLLVAAIWGINYSIIKIAMKEIPPLPFNGIRLILASAALLFWLWISGENLKIKKEHLGKIIFLAIAGHTIYQFIFIYGIYMTTVSNTAVLFSTVPVMVCLFSSFLKYEKIKLPGWLGIITAFVGVYIVITGKGSGFSFSLTNLKGDALILLAAILWAYYGAASTPLLKVYSPLKFVTLTMGIGSLLFFPFSIKALGELDFSSISAVAWIFLLCSGVFSLSLALIIWFFSVKKVGSSQTAVYSYLPPLFAVVFAYFILAESIHRFLIIGGVIIFLGLFFTRLGREAV